MTRHTEDRRRPKAKPRGDLWAASVVILVKGILTAALGMDHMAEAAYSEKDIIAGLGTALEPRVFALALFWCGASDLINFKGLKERSRTSWQMCVLNTVGVILVAIAGMAGRNVPRPLLLLQVGSIALIFLLAAGHELRSGI